MVIFGSLATLVLLTFQNCSSSIAALGFGTPTRASDISEMLQKSRIELDSTVNHFKSNERGINSVPTEKTKNKISVNFTIGKAISDLVL